MANDRASLEASRNHVETMSEKAIMKDCSQQKTERFVLSERRSVPLVTAGLIAWVALLAIIASAQAF